MKRIPQSYSIVAYRNELLFSQAATAADPDAAGHAAAFEGLLGEALSLAGKAFNALAAVTQAHAVVAVADALSDRAIMRLGREALVESEGQRDRPPYSVLFNVAPSEIAGWPLRKACGYVRDRLVPAAATLPEGSRLRPLIAEAALRATAAIEALDRRSAAEGARALVGAEVDEWKEGVNRLRLATYGELLKTAATKGYGRAWADTFFPRYQRVGEPVASDGNEAPASDAPEA